MNTLQLRESTTVMFALMPKSVNSFVSLLIITKSFLCATAVHFLEKLSTKQTFGDSIPGYYTGFTLKTLTPCMCSCPNNKGINKGVETKMNHGFFCCPPLDWLFFSWLFSEKAWIITDLFKAVLIIGFQCILFFNVHLLFLTNHYLLSLTLLLYVYRLYVCM